MYKRKIFRTFFIVLILVLSRCGLFLPGNPENPDNTILDVDPLKFKDILSSNKEQFVFQDYEDLFSGDFGYRDVFVPTDTFNKEKVISRIQTIKQRYVENNTKKKIQVQWEYTTDIEPPFDKNAPVVLQPRKYRAFLIDTILPPDNDTLYKFDFHGEAIFNLRYDSSKERWQISKWKDKNDGSGKPFFHPLCPTFY